MAARDVERLLAWFDDGVLVRPDASAPNSVHLSNAIASLCGVPSVRLAAAGQTIASAIGDYAHYIFVMADGLGMNLVDALPEDSFLRSHLAMEMQSPFPSTTAVTLTSLATGEWPASHGVPGWFVYLPEHDVQAMPLPFTERVTKRPLGEVGVGPADVFVAASRMPAFAFEPCSFVPEYIANSVYSEYSTGGSSAVSYESLGSGCAAVASRVASARSNTYSYLYVPFVDKEQHTHGPASAAAAKAVRTLERAMAHLHDDVTVNARIVISADHGLLEVEPAAQHELLDGDELLDLLLTPPSCEPRVPAFHVRPGKHAEFDAAFRARFGATHALLTIDEVDELRLFGPDPLAVATRGRLGDYIAISAGAEAIMYKPDDVMLGFHGGMAAAEMRIPLIVV